MLITVLGNLIKSGHADVQNIYSSIETWLSGHLFCEASWAPKGNQYFLELLLANL